MIKITFSVNDTTVNYDTTLKSSNIEIAQHALQKIKMRKMQD